MRRCGAGDVHHWAGSWAAPSYGQEEMPQGKPQRQSPCPNLESGTGDSALRGRGERGGLRLAVAGLPGGPRPQHLLVFEGAGDGGGGRCAKVRKCGASRGL